ncbi:FAD-dependent oxidoreductase [Streptomyces sp. CG4]|uniref:FAD-dependent oxidoreductase n=1 Tax=Streptomyces sp. CG4 TaxID=408783 RepID=UPI0034E1B912
MYAWRFPQLRERRFVLGCAGAGTVPGSPGPESPGEPSHAPRGRGWRNRSRTRQFRIAAVGTGLDINRRELLLPGGEQLPFDGLVIASGVEARHLPGTPLHSERVWMLRTPTDARTIDAALAGARHVAVIGGGFIGCEIGRTARTRALDVTITDVSPTLLHRSLGPALGAVARGPAPRPRRPSPPRRLVAATPPSGARWPGMSAPVPTVPRFWSARSLRTPPSLLPPARPARPLRPDRPPSVPTPGPRRAA